MLLTPMIARIPVWHWPLHVASAAACLLGAMGLPAHAQRPPNIVLIYVDDLGWRDVGFMGSRYYETPQIDRLAAEGTVFTAAYANAPNCAPSRASLLSGAYPPRHGIYTVAPAARGPARLRRLVPAPDRTALDTGLVTLAEALRERGYVSAAIGKWHLGGPGSLPEDHGFDVGIAGAEYGATPTHFAPYRRARRVLPDVGDTGPPGEYLTDRLTDEALRFMNANADRPFFLYLSHYAVHTPIEAKAALAARFAARPAADGQSNPDYAAMVASVDESVGRVLARLDTLGLASTTIVIFHSDNGGFGPVTSMAPLRGAKGMLYEGGIRVPLAVRWPGHVRAATTCDEPVIGLDLYPTVLALVGAADAHGAALDGVSLADALTAGAALPERALFWHFPAYLEADAATVGPWRTTPAGAIRLGRYKLLEFFEDGHTELYDLAADPGEQRDLTDALPAISTDLRQRLHAWQDSTGAPVPRQRNPAYEGQ